MNFEEIFANYPETLIDMAKQIRAVVINIDKRIEENAYGSKVPTVLYSIGDSNQVLYGIGLGKDHVKVYLHHTQNADTATLKLEGQGKHARTVKVKTIDDDYLSVMKQVMSNIRDVANY